MNGNGQVRQHLFPKKRFQAATVTAIDQHAAAIQQLHELLQAHGGVLADLAVARDEHRERIAACEDMQDALQRSTRSFWGRLGWLLTGK